MYKVFSNVFLSNPDAELSQSQICGAQFESNSVWWLAYAMSYLLYAFWANMRKIALQNHLTCLFVTKGTFFCPSHNKYSVLICGSVNIQANANFTGLPYEHDTALEKKHLY